MGVRGGGGGGGGCGMTCCVIVMTVIVIMYFLFHCSLVPRGPGNEANSAVYVVYATVNRYSLTVCCGTCVLIHTYCTLSQLHTKNH